MKTSYNIFLKKDLYDSALRFIEKVKGTKPDITINIPAGLEIMSGHPDWFCGAEKNYKAYFAFLEAYHRVVYYEKYFEKYNFKDEHLEKALKDWKDIVNPKPTLKELLSKLFRDNQK